MPRKNKILLRSGTTTPSAVDFDVAEPAFDKSTGKLYVKSAAGSMVEVGANATPSAILQPAYLITENVTLGTNRNGLSLNSVEVASGCSVEIPSGATWTIAVL